MVFLQKSGAVELNCNKEHYQTLTKVFNSPTQENETVKTVPKTIDMIKTQKTTVTDVNDSQGSECLFDKSETESAFGTAPTSPKKDTPLVEQIIIPDESEIPNMDECKQSTRMQDEETVENMGDCKQSTKIADQEPIQIDDTKPIQIDETERISEEDELE